MRTVVLGSSTPDDGNSSSDSMTGDFPRGWGLQAKIKSPNRNLDDDLKKSPKRLAQGQGTETEETENELDAFEKTIQAFSPPSDSDNSSFDDSIGSVDDEISEAVEKEFLAHLKWIP